MKEFVLEIEDSKKCALFQAAVFGDIKLVQYLLDKGLGIDSQDEEGDTPLHHAVRYGRNALVAYLLRRQASVFIKNKKGRTVILEAYGNNQGQLATEITRQVVERRSVKSIIQPSYNKKKDLKKERFDNFIKECKEHIRKNYLNRGIFSRLMARHNERARVLIQALGRCSSVKETRGLIKNQCDLFEKGKPTQAIPSALLVKRWSVNIKNKPSNISNSSFYKTLSSMPGESLLLFARNRRPIRIMPKQASILLSTRV